ncbi:hypothetical protein GQ457_04G036080 [Hibiscus cannabinus]
MDKIKLHGRLRSKATYSKGIFLRINSSIYGKYLSCSHGHLPCSHRAFPLFHGLHGAGFPSVSSNGPSRVVSLASPTSLSEPLGPPGVRVSRSLARGP